MDRRGFLRRASLGLTSAALLAGCTSGDGGTDTESEETTEGDAGSADTETGTATTQPTTTGSDTPTTDRSTATGDTSETSAAVGTDTGSGDATDSVETGTAGTENGSSETEDGTDSTTETADNESAVSTNATGTATVVSEDVEGTLTVATYSSFTGEGTAGTWLKSAFEARYPNATVEFTVPENGLNQYIQRASQGAPIDADVYVGLNTGELVRVDQKLDDPLFATTDGIEGADRVKDGLRIDPDGRAIPYDTGYISLVYDEDEIEAPESFEALLESVYENALIVENAQESDPGRAFVLWSIIDQGADGYLDYWKKLLDNGVQVSSDWETAYQAYNENQEAPMVVSYSTDQVFYHGEGVDMSRHQVGFLNDQGYANPEAMAQFTDTDAPELARRFMEFVLTEEAQAEIATRNVQFPAVEGVEPSGEFGEYAIEPPEPVTMSYDDLAGNVEGWIDEWAREVVGSG